MFKEIPMVGVEIIDREHRDLFLFASQVKNDKDDIGKILLYFLDVVQYHFFHEETYMVEIRYDGTFYREHVDEHKRLRFKFLTELVSLHRLDDKEEVVNKIQDFMDELVHHIITFDSLLADWVKREVKK